MPRASSVDGRFDAVIYLFPAHSHVPGSGYFCPGFISPDIMNRRGDIIADVDNLACFLVSKRDILPRLLLAGYLS